MKEPASLSEAEARTSGQAAPPRSPSALSDPGQAAGRGDAEGSHLKEVMVRLAEFLQLTPGSGQGGPASLDLLMDVTVPIHAELGHASLKIGEVLKLEAGSVVELDRNVSQPVDLTVRGVLFARGEVVVVGDRFGIRITELLQPRGGKKVGQ